jgi:tetratricopeptide (TPR) repeat protein
MISSTRPDHFAFDHLRHSAAQDLLPEHQEDFQRLVKLLRHTSGFQLCFARIRDLPYRDGLIAKLDDLLAPADRKSGRLDLSERERFPDFTALENELLASAPGLTAIHLLNGEAWLQGDNLAAFNLRRTALAQQLKLSLLWWLPPSAIERIAQQAPDAWSWRSAVVDFATEPAPPADRPAQAEQPPTYTLSLAQRSRRLAELNQQLKQEVPDSFRLPLFLEQAELLESLGQLSDAETVLRQQALPLAELGKDERAYALIQGQIADILYLRGEYDDALRIHREEALPVYEKLGDVRARAITLGKIADIHSRHGEYDEALRIRREEELPVFEKLGDARARAITLGQIADIHYWHGEYDEALRIHREEELPVYEKLGDVRERAITQGKIADIHFVLGEYDEALRIRREEQLPVFEKLGDVRERAITQGKIADIHDQRGEYDEALRIRREEQLPVLEMLGDVRSLLVGRANLAITLMHRRQPGDLDEARALLNLALQDAARLHLPEQETLRNLLQSLAVAGQ